LPTKRAGCKWIEPAVAGARKIKVLAHRPTTWLGIDEPSPYDHVVRLIDDFNKRSSICGSAIELVDSNLAEAGDAVAVMGLPLDPVFDDAIADGRFERMAIPVVGGDGLAAHQHTSPAVYPVGTSAAALTRTAVHHAYGEGARTYAVVHDATNRFGSEAAEALKSYVNRLGGTVKASIAVDPVASTLATRSEEFSRACGNHGCDFVFLALLPGTALTWLSANPQPAKIRLAALPTLLTSGFADGCFKTGNEQCDGLTAWSGFIPPFGEHADNLEAAYAWSTQLDNSRKGSAMVEAAVISARVLLEAMIEAGPRLTRSSLHRALERMTFISNVTSPLQWSRQVPRVGNRYAKAWSLVVQHAAHTAKRYRDRAEQTAQQQRLDGSAYSPVDTGDHAALPGREWHEVGTGWRGDPQ
ncbi:MAG: ABC transporter substrate-binding protein, partial [Actinobacteria bacterium]|nr:ABC transporter substrate-binding protein [Actinomycetota bacterium]